MALLVKLWLFALLLQVAPPAFATPDPLIPENVSIVLAAEVNSEGQKDFVEMCENLGPSLLVGKGVWGEGVFKAFRCLADGKYDSTALDWRLLVREKEGSTEFVLVRVVRRGTSLETIPTADLTVAYPISTLKDARLAEIVAYDLLNALPFSRLIEGVHTLSFSHAEDDKFVPEPPAIYDIFTLDSSSANEPDAWIPKSIGKAAIQSNERDDRGKTSVTWQLDFLTAVDVPKNVAIWARKNGNRDENHAAIMKILDERAHSIGSRKNEFASGYAGFRYGHSLTTGDPLLRKLRMVGIFADVRDGPLSGLRWNWDLAPKVSVKKTGRTLAFSWSRTNIGWSLGGSWGLISRADIVPRIGLMDLDATLGVPSRIAPENIYSVQFRRKNVLNLGIEAGVEFSNSWRLVRIWGASDVSGFADVDGQTKVSLLRGGIDGFFHLFPVLNHKVSLLAFLTREQIKLEKKSLKDDETVGTTGGKLAGLTYNLVYAGLGLATTW